MRTKTQTKIVKQIKNRSKRREIETIEEIELIPTPSTLFNLACSDNPHGGLRSGRMINLIGDSSSGKSIFALSIFALMNQYKRFREYRFIYDDVENANSFNMQYLFGKKTADRIEAPTIDKEGDECPSNTIEDFHCNISDAIDQGSPFVYVLDSFDALDSDQDIEKVEKMRKARKKGKKEAGSYGLSKARKSSEILRNIVSDIKKTESILIIISQTRDNINPLSFEKKSRSGGKALKFYATHEIWLAMARKLKKKDKIIGNQVKAKISKNKITGKIREISFPIFYDYGVDDIQSCIDFLTTEKIWKKNKLTINAKHFKVKATQAKLIKHIEKNNLEKKLRKLVGKEWNKIEESLKLNRKPRFK